MSAFLPIAPSRHAEDLRVVFCDRTNEVKGFFVAPFKFIHPANSRHKGLCCVRQADEQTSVRCIVHHWCQAEAGARRYSANIVLGPRVALVVL